MAVTRRAVDVLQAAASCRTQDASRNAERELIESGLGFFSSEFTCEDIRVLCLLTCAAPWSRYPSDPSSTSPVRVECTYITHDLFDTFL